MTFVVVVAAAVDQRTRNGVIVVLQRSELPRLNDQSPPSTTSTKHRDDMQSLKKIKLTATFRARES